MTVSLSTAIRLVLWTGCLGLASQTIAEEFSGPQPGEALPALKATLAYGLTSGQTVDFIDRASGKPTLLVIVNGSNRPAARLTRILMNFAAIHSKKLFAGVIYLHGDRTAALEDLRRAVSWWQVAAPVGVSIDGVEGPGSYGLNRNVNLTVLVANKGRVIGNYALVQPSETDAPRIIKQVVSLVGGNIPTPAEVVFLSAPTAKPPNARWHTAPSDPELRKLICSALATTDPKQTRLAAAAVEQYVADNEARQASLGRAAGLLLERKALVTVRDLPIRPQLVTWRKQFGKPTAH